MEDKETGTAKEKLHAQAIKRYDIALEAWDENRAAALEDKEFLNGDQWTQEAKDIRSRQNRPCLVVDKLNQYVNQVINDGRQNRPSAKARPVDNEGDIEIAEVFDGLIRHIQDRSNADQAYDCALENSASAGFGFFRVLTEYAHPGTFEQEISIDRIRNIMNVLIDPFFKKADASDINYAFIIDEMPKDEFESEHPKAEKTNWQDDGGSYAEGWLEDNTVRVCEYFYMEEELRTLSLLADGTSIERSLYDKAVSEGIEVPEIVEEREIPFPIVKWCRLSGAEVLEERDWLGSYIPVVFVSGHEVDIDGKVHYAGMVRAAKDPQRLYNYSRSAFAERVALTPKSPYIASAGQVEDFEEEWMNANTGSSSVLRYNPEDVNGTPLPPPVRQSAVDIPAGFAQDIQISEHDIQGSLGMYNASLGEASGEKSGRAIMARQREGDVATFHYHDNLNRAIGYCGRILVDLIPKVYDSKRALRILGEDGDSEQIEVNPMQDQAIVETDDGKKIFNLNVGKYDITMSTGPSYTSKRAEAAEAMMQLTQANPALFQIIGDLAVRSMDWPGADEIAKRLKAMLPPEIQALEQQEEGGESPEVQQIKMQAEQMMSEMAGQMEQMQAALQEAEAKANTEQQKVAVEQMKLQIEQFKAETERMNLEMEQAVEAQKSQESMLTAQVKKAESDAKLQIEQFNAEVAAFEAETDRMKAESDAACAARSKDDDATSMLEELFSSLDADNNGIPDAMERDNTEELVAAITRPRKVVRGEDGKVEGIE